jgi:CrcB protein
MRRLLLVGLGGMLGSMLRYLVGTLVLELKRGDLFPYETLAVNVTGCLAIGFLTGLAELRGLFGAEARAFLLVGVIGGFTTFSSFGYETLQLLRDGQHAAALASVGLQLGLGLGCVWLGDTIARML